MQRKVAEQFTDAVFEIAKREDRCGDPKCNRMHAVIGVLVDDKLRKEAIELMKTGKIGEENLTPRKEN